MTTGHPIRFRPTGLLAWVRGLWPRLLNWWEPGDESDIRLLKDRQAEEQRLAEQGRVPVLPAPLGMAAREILGLGADGPTSLPPAARDWRPPITCHLCGYRAGWVRSATPAACSACGLPYPDPELRNPIGKDGMRWPPQGGSGLRPKPPATAVPGPGRRRWS